MEESKVKIISYMNNGERVCASAARISNTPGSAIDLFNTAEDVDKNRNLIGKVVKSNHTSITEHMVFTIAFSNVSAVVEQFIIEFRLISPTVKSRRYVDYSTQGYTIPDGVNDVGEFKAHAEYLLDAYKKLVNLNIPREDARFLLPYCFADNFYLTVNARELANIISEARHGRGKNIKELQGIIDDIIAQLSDICPAALSIIENEQLDLEYFNYDNFTDNIHEPSFILNNWCTTNITHSNVKLAHCVGSNSIVKLYNLDGVDINDFSHSNRARELEFTNAVTSNSISLAGLTHLERHRMQSLIIPSLFSIECGSFIMPESIRSNSEALEIYTDAATYANNYRAELIKDKDPAQIYFLLAGNIISVLTSMNGKELRTFFALRCCERAQWEIRNIANNMLTQAKEQYPEIFNNFGPSCTLLGRCPERESCGHPKFINRGDNTNE